MPYQEHLKVIKQGPVAWNYWRVRTRDDRPLLMGAELSGYDLSGMELRAADLRNSNLSGANLTGANLIDADLANANLSGANLYAANLKRANLTKANLSGANLSAELTETNLTGASLKEADFTGAVIGWSIFARTNLSGVKGLESARHLGPSTVGVDTLYLSQGPLPEVFLRGAGLPEEFIVQAPSLVLSVKPIQFDSCFISYSHEDEEFAQRLHTELQNQHLRVWYAPEDVQAGKKLHAQIFEAIQYHDRLLLVISESSMQSEWVTTEIRRARKVELQERRRKLFPIRLVDFHAIQEWEVFDADTGKDLAIELREYYIPDFSGWKHHDLFKREFLKLVEALRTMPNNL